MVEADGGVLSRVYMWIAREHLWRNIQKEYWYCGCIVRCRSFPSFPSSFADYLSNGHFPGGNSDASPHPLLDETVQRTVVRGLFGRSHCIGLDMPRDHVLVSG